MFVVEADGVGIVWARGAILSSGRRVFGLFSFRSGSTIGVGSLDEAEDDRRFRLPLPACDGGAASIFFAFSIAFQA